MPKETANELWMKSRDAAAGFINARPEDVALVENAS
jgi:hypothetical protein